MHSSVIELRSRVERDSSSVMITPNIFLILGVDGLDADLFDGDYRMEGEAGLEFG